MGLLKDSKLRESLTRRPPEDMRQLMRRIEEYKCLEDDQLQNKGKAPLLNRSRQGVFPLRPQKDLRMQEPEAQMGEVNVAFKEPVHKIIDRIRTNRSLDGRTRWGATRLERTKTCIVHTTRIRGTPPSNIGY